MGTEALGTNKVIRFINASASKIIAPVERSANLISLTTYQDGLMGRHVSVLQ